MRTLAITGLATLVVAIACGAVAAQGPLKFKTRLSWVPIDPTTAPTITGTGSATAELIGNTLTVSAVFNGLRSRATTAQLRRSYKTGVRGSVLFDLTVTKATSGTVTGSIQLSVEQIDDLKKGKLYVQIDSDKAPEGNLWGWLLP
jgi:CHRD domain-containing protein